MSLTLQQRRHRRRAAKRSNYHIVIRILQWGGYITTTPPAGVPDIATALKWAGLSGYAAADIPSYPNGQRLGRIWIEDRRHPAVDVMDYQKVK